MRGRAPGRGAAEFPLVMRPDSSDAVRGLAAPALKQQDYEEAYRLHRQLIDLGEKAGLICQKRGLAADAAQFYRQALTEDRQFAEALLNPGHALMAMGQARCTGGRRFGRRPSSRSGTSSLRWRRAGLRRSGRVA